jgi:glycosyltransferase involved in cell wall biosynthesis
MGTVALVHDFLIAFGGAEQVLLELHELYPEAPIYTLLASDTTIEKYFPQAAITTSSLQKSPLRRRQQLLLGRMPRAIEEFSFSGYDTVISSSGAFAHGIITGPATRHICYCHSPMRYAWDWHAEYLEERGFTDGAKFGAISQLLSGVRLWDQVSAKRVDHWLANSRTVQDRIAKFYRQPSEIIYPPVDTDFFRLGGTREKYVVTLCRLSTYKRVDLLIEACAAEKLPLVVIGEGSERIRLQSLARRRNADVRFVGHISNEAVRTYLQKAACFAYAAEEDFGIAAVEALACGTPVVALGVGGLTETVENGRTGIFFTEPTVSAVRNALRKVGEIKTPAEGIRATSLRFSREAFRSMIHQAIGNA